MVIDLPKLHNYIRLCAYAILIQKPIQIFLNINFDSGFQGFSDSNKCNQLYKQRDKQNYTNPHFRNFFGKCSDKKGGDFELWSNKKMPTLLG